MTKVVVFDLDDTLYKEIDYLKSAYRYIASVIAAKSNNMDLYSKMWEMYCHKEDVLGWLSHQYSSFPLQQLLEMYRSHVPSITLSVEIRDLLVELRECVVLGIITDGRSISQRNKIVALGLNEFFPNDNILISEELGHEKPSIHPYRFFMEKYPKAKYYYIGDNTSKDFVTPIELKWECICILDDGRNIHKQNMNIHGINYVSDWKEVNQLIIK